MTDGPEATPSIGALTPDDRETLRQLGIAGELLELCLQRGSADYPARALEFNRRHNARDVVSGLVWAAEFFGEAAAAGDPGWYASRLSAWRRTAEVIEALGPVFDEGDASN